MVSWRQLNLIALEIKRIKTIRPVNWVKSREIIQQRLVADFLSEVSKILTAIVIGLDS